MKYLFFIMLVLFVSCGASDSARSENRNKEYEEYMRILGWAMVSNDISEINYAIKYVNDIIERDGEKYIHSIYYDKARLLFRTGKYSEALEILDITEFNYDIQKAALLILIGKDSDAEAILNNFLFDYIQSINAEVDIEERHVGILVLISRLLDKNFDITLRDNNNPGLNAAMMYEWANIYDSSKEDILRSMWPAMLIGAQN